VPVATLTLTVSNMSNDTESPGLTPGRARTARIARKLDTVDPDDMSRTYRRAFEAVADPHQATLFQYVPARIEV
jgi:hypothetical protein